METTPSIYTLKEAGQRLGLTQGGIGHLLKMGMLERAPRFGKCVVVTVRSVETTLRALTQRGLIALLKVEKKYETASPKLRAYGRKRRYGIDHTEVEQRILAQGGGCAVCGGPITEATCHVDHDHATGAVRGILCSKCNHGLGLLGDTRNHLERAVAYLSATSH